MSKARTGGPRRAHARRHGPEMGNIQAFRRCRGVRLGCAGSERDGGVSMKANVPPAAAKIGAVDVEAFAKNLAHMVEQGGKALAAYMKPREEGQIQPGLSDEMTDM